MPRIFTTLSALVAAALSSLCAGADPSESPAWTRVRQGEDRVLKLQLAARTFAPRDGADSGPVITLLGAVHVADASFYRQVTRVLEAENDVILFEGVRPSGSGEDAIPGAGGPDPAARTRDRIRLAAIIVERGARALSPKGGVSPAYPESLEGLADALTRAGRGRDAGFLKSAMVDGWGRALRYERLEPRGVKPNGAAFVITSLGADGSPGGEGVDADIRLDELPALRPSEVGDEPGIQKRLASALGLTFQLDSMSTHGPKWINADMSVDQVQRRLDAAGADAGVLFSVLDGSGLTARLAGMVLGLVERVPGLSVRGKVMMIELLGAIDGDLMASAPGPGGGNMKQLMGVIVNERNQVVVDELRSVMKNRPECRRIAVLYGAGHMPDLARRLSEQLGYEHRSGKWFTAIRVDLDAAGIDQAEIDLTRASIGMQVEALRRAGKP